MFFTVTDLQIAMKTGDATLTKIVAHEARSWLHRSSKARRCAVEAWGGADAASQMIRSFRRQSQIWMQAQLGLSSDGERLRRPPQASINDFAGAGKLNDVVGLLDKRATHWLNEAVK